MVSLEKKEFVCTCTTTQHKTTVMTTSADELKAEGNAHFQGGRFDEAIASYRSALDALNRDDDSSTAAADDPLLKPTILANLALVHLKRGRGDAADAAGCIAACDEAVECLDSISPSSKVVSAEKRAQLRCKALYRRARGRVAASTTSTGAGDNNNGTEDEGSATSSLNAAARDLLDVLQIDPGNTEAAALLAWVRERYGTSKRESGSDMAKALAGVLVVSSATPSGGDGEETNADIDKAVDRSLKMIMGLLTRDVASAAMELGRRGGVSKLMEVAANASQRGGGGQRRRQYYVYKLQHRVLALHALSAACSHGPFVRRYACPNALQQEELAHLISESCGGCAAVGSAGTNAAATDDRPQQVAVAAIALFLRLVVHLDHTDEKMAQPSAHDVNGPSVCRALVAGLSAPPSEDSTTCHRAAIDLLSAWTASDRDALASAAEASDVYLESAATGGSSKQSNRLSEAQMTNLKPKEFAQYKKKMYEIHKHNQERARENAILFCDMETGGLTALLDCAVSTNDHSLRREIGGAIGRLVASFEEDEDVMKLVGPLLGYTGSIPSSTEGEGQATGTSSDMLTIEEINDEEEESKETDVEASSSDGPLVLEKKRGQLVSALLLGKGEIGVWAFKSGWADGRGVTQLEGLVLSGDPTSMSIASEIISAAASVEKGRPLLTTIVEKGCIETLLACDNREVRSGAASAIAKLGLANKDLSSDEGEVFGLLQIAAELVTGTAEDDKQLIRKTNKIKSGSGSTSSSSSPSDTTAIDRGIEVLSYLCSKTNIKEEIAHGFKAQSAATSILERLVELASAPDAGETHSAYGLATIFSLIAVSNQTLRDEAFAKADITSEQYDQLQALGKTEEEKELDKKHQDLDPKDAVSSRIVRMANANVPRAMVKLTEGSSEATKEMLVIGMNRMAVDQTVRGFMIQQGCLSACLKVEKSESPSDVEKKTWHQARHCVAKLLVTTNPGLLTVSQRMGSIGPLIQLIHDHESTDLSRFEALMAITNLVSLDEETKDKVIAEKGIARLGYAMFSDHEMVRRAATEAMSNLIPHPEMMKYLTDPENIRLWVAFAREFDENLECSRAAIGCLAMASQDPAIAEVLAASAHFEEMATSLLECGNLELMHRVLVCLLNMSDHGDKCKEAVISSGCGVFCLAYVQSYQDGTMASGLNFNEQEKGLLLVTVDLAKEISKLCEK